MKVKERIGKMIATTMLAFLPSCTPHYSYWPIPQHEDQIGTLQGTLEENVEECIFKSMGESYGWIKQRKKLLAEKKNPQRNLRMGYKIVKEEDTIRNRMRIFMFDDSDENSRLDYGEAIFGLEKRPGKKAMSLTTLCTGEIPTIMKIAENQIIESTKVAQWFGASKISRLHFLRPSPGSYKDPEPVPNGTVTCDLPYPPLGQNPTLYMGTLNSTKGSAFFLVYLETGQDLTNTVDELLEKGLIPNLRMRHLESGECGIPMSTITKKLGEKKVNECTPREIGGKPYNCVTLPDDSFEEYGYKKGQCYAIQKDRLTLLNCTNAPFARAKSHYEEAEMEK